ncbi:uncharacterized protein PAC_19183 [Phialocephala subalpina]|uniref:Uncharacterized protein n=1 Tax=Phialocephala subalpina TaxID=576137 RepID=A0A1L7XW64_9HELO|nr:uncharacterized protein PAC_19183 [Phialocephala subalpina]
MLEPTRAQRRKQRVRSAVRQKRHWLHKDHDANSPHILGLKITDTFSSADDGKSRGRFPLQSYCTPQERSVKSKGARQQSFRNILRFSVSAIASDRCVLNPNYRKVIASELLGEIIEVDFRHRHSGTYESTESREEG